MQTYSEFSPTAFDRPGAFLPDRQDWLVAPVSITRDSGPLSTSNFETLRAELATLDPGNDDHEIHRFGHWGPGWFELILIRPDTPCAAAAESAESALSEYPVLNDADHSDREWQEIQEAWGYTSMRDRMVILARHGLSIFAARRDDVPQGLPYYDDFYSPQG